MYSTALEVTGLACFVVVGVLVGGAIGGFAVGGLALLFLGAATDDAALGKQVRRTAAVPLRLVGSIRGRYREQKLVEDLLGRPRLGA